LGGRIKTSFERGERKSTAYLDRVKNSGFKEEERRPIGMSTPSTGFNKIEN